MSVSLILYIVVGLLALVGSAFVAQMAFRRVEHWMAFMDHIYNPPGQRPFPVSKPW